MSGTQLGLAKEKTAGRRGRAVLQKQTDNVDCASIDCAFTTQSAPARETARNANAANATAASLLSALSAAGFRQIRWPAAGSSLKAS
jgi:hypothetical protein